MSSSPPLHNLSGKVRKIDKYYFANGGLADVWKGELSTKNSTRIVAVKVIRSVFTSEHLEYLKTKFLQEAQVWSRLDHPNITPFLGICFDLGVPSAPCLVCPYYAHGNIAQYLRKFEVPVADTARIQLVCQVAAGLAYLHEHKIIHGDMKASNVLVNDKREACISDFGLSRILEVTGFTTKSVGGTCRWMAQELIAPSDDEEESIPRVTTETDVWAFAMTVIEILTDRLPFDTIKFDAAVLLAIMKGGRPSRNVYGEICDDIWELLERCWDADPAKRPTMKLLVPKFVRIHAELSNSEQPTEREHEGDSGSMHISRAPPSFASYSFWRF